VLNVDQSCMCHCCSAFLCVQICRLLTAVGDCCSWSIVPWLFLVDCSLAVLGLDWSHEYRFVMLASGSQPNRSCAFPFSTSGSGLLGIGVVTTAYL
jgi:hypothetical protein